MRLALERRKVQDLVAYDKNAKNHDDEDINAIVRSIVSFGFNDPVAVTPDGVLVEGHGRVEAARRLGIEEIPVIVLSDMDERKIKLYRIAHNRISLNTGFDFGKLCELVKELGVSLNLTLEDMGFTSEAAFNLTAMMPENAAAKLPSRPLSGYSYEVVWDDLDQKKKVLKVLKALMAGHKERTGEEITLTQALMMVMDEEFGHSPKLEREGSHATVAN